MPISILTNLKGSPLAVDEMTNTLGFCDHECLEINEGNHFHISNYVTGLASGAEIEFVLTTPDTTKWTHMTFTVWSSAGASLDFYVGTTTVVGGTTITPANNNGNSSNTTGMTIVKDPDSIGSDGVKISGYLAGANREAGVAERTRKMILKQGETHLVRITSTGNSNSISWDANWSEHTNLV